MSTGEFRATPDVSASTAQFQAFAERSSDQAARWDMAAPARSPARLAILIAGGVVALAIIVILIATLA